MSAINISHTPDTTARANVMSVKKLYRWKNYQSDSIGVNPSSSEWETSSDGRINSGNSRKPSKNISFGANMNPRQKVVELLEHPWDWTMRNLFRDQDLQVAIIMTGVLMVSTLEANQTYSKDGPNLSGFVVTEPMEILESEEDEWNSEEE